MRRTSLALALVALTLACSKHGDAPSKDQAKDAAVAATPEAEAKPGDGESPTDANTSDAKNPIWWDTPRRRGLTGSASWRGSGVAVADIGDPSNVGPESFGALS